MAEMLDVSETLKVESSSGTKATDTDVQRKLRSIESFRGVKGIHPPRRSKRESMVPSVPDLITKSERQQLAAFKGWFNAHLQERGIQVDSLQDAIATVVPLIHLLEILSNGKIPGIVKQHKKPRHRFDRIAALQLCLDFINKHSKKKLGIVYDKDRLLAGKDPKLALALGYRIISDFDIHETVEDYQVSRRGTTFKGAQPKGKAGTVSAVLKDRTAEIKPSPHVPKPAPFVHPSAKGASSTPTIREEVSIPLTEEINLDESDDEEDSKAEELAEAAAKDNKEMVDWVNFALVAAGSDAKSTVSNLTSDFVNGHILIELINLAILEVKDVLIEEDLVRMAEVEVTDIDRKIAILKQLFSHAELHAGMPQMIIVEDFVQNPDQKAMMAYLSLLKDRIEKTQATKRKEREYAAMAPEAAAAARAAAEDTITPLEVLRLKEDRDHQENVAAMSEMELELTRGILAKERDDFEVERAAWDEERRRMIGKMDLANARIAELTVTRDDLRLEVSRLTEDNARMDEIVRKIEENVDGSERDSRMLAKEVESFYKSKLQSMAGFIQSTKDKKAADDIEMATQLKMAKESALEWRGKCEDLVRDAQRMYEYLEDALNDVSIKEAQLEQSQLRIAQVLNDLANQDMMWKLQIEELGHYINDMRSKSATRAVLDRDYIDNFRIWVDSVRRYYAALGAVIPRGPDPRYPIPPVYPTDSIVQKALGIHRKIY